jgi:hypothetical protein
MVAYEVEFLFLVIDQLLVLGWFLP